MRASRTHHSRQIQYHAPDLRFDGRIALENQIVDLLLRRSNPMTFKQICQWFRGTTPEFVQDVLLHSDKIHIQPTRLGRQRANASYTYFVEGVAR